MKTKYGAVLIAVAFVVLGCTQKVNDPADVQAIKKSCEDFLKACVAKDAKAVAALMTETAVYADENVPLLQGKEAIQKYHQRTFDQFDFEFTLPVADAQAFGDFGVARGSFTLKLIPKGTGLASSRVSGNWMTVLKRQGDGSWKWDQTVANSDQPAPGNTASGEDEQALLQIERDWAQALQKSDAAGFEKYLAKEWTYTSDGQVTSRAQMLSEMTRGAYKIESAQMTELNPHVFGDVAVVTMTAIMKGKYKGADFPSPVRSTDFFVKREGRWQAVSTENITIK